MAEYTFRRLLRLPYSEAFVIEGDEGPLGRVDLHYGLTLVHGTLTITDLNFPPEELQQLISQLYDRLVLSSDSADEFMVVVFQGREIGYYRMGAESEEPEQP